MLKVLSYEEIDKDQWQELVRTSATGTWFQTPEAYCLYESLPELFKPFVVAVERVRELENERVSELKGVCMGFVTVEKSAAKQFFTRRAIIMGGPALADDATEEEVTALMKAVVEKLEESITDNHSPITITESPIYIESRNFNDYSRWKDAFAAAGFEYRPHLNFHVNCTDKEKMWERLSENRRRQIRHSGESGVTIADLRLEIGDSRLEIGNCRLENGELEIREWYDILERLYKKKVKTPLWPVEFFLEAYRQGVGRFLLVKYEDKVIGGSFCVELKRNKSSIINHKSSINAQGIVYEWFECGLNSEYKEQYPSVMATWAGMEYAAENGMARYDMMGAGEPDAPYGVRDFKSEFGGEEVEQGRFLYIAKPMLYKVGTIGVKILKRLS